MKHTEILKFWFEEVNSSQWWVKDEKFDKLIVDRFSGVHSKAIRCELFKWRETAGGRLAEIIILDQFSRNMFRNYPLSFAYDSLSMVLSQEAISVGADCKLEPLQRHFLYMPFIHSESLEIHEIAIKLIEKSGIHKLLDYEIKHRNIIQRFGRYPHRNKILGRVSTAEEIQFLKTPGSGF
jgi:uncharacterized protein (DUF924 family)